MFPAMMQHATSIPCLRDPTSPRFLHGSQHPIPYISATLLHTLSPVPPCLGHQVLSNSFPAAFLAHCRLHFNQQPSKVANHVGTPESFLCVQASTFDDIARFFWMRTRPFKLRREGSGKVGEWRGKIVAIRTGTGLTRDPVFEK